MCTPLRFSQALRGTGTGAGKRSGDGELDVAGRDADPAVGLQCGEGVDDASPFAHDAVTARPGGRVPCLLKLCGRARADRLGAVTRMAAESRAPCLPAEALARWQQREEGSEDPVARVAGWWGRLTARMVCSGGRLSRMLIAEGMCTVEELAACVAAQLAAGPVPDSALHYDVSADLDVIVERGPVDMLAGLSATIAESPELDDGGYLHGEIAARLLGVGRDAEAMTALGRTDWYRVPMELLARHGSQMHPKVRAAVIERTAQTIRETHLPVEYHVDLWVQLAVVTGDRRWLAEARAALAAIPADLLAGTPDVEHPQLTLAWGLAKFEAFGEAMTCIASLSPHDRWLAHVRLLPLAPAEARAAIVAEILAAVEPLELSWVWVVEAAPETCDQALRAIAAMTDEDERFGLLAAMAETVRGAEARRICAQLLAGVVGLAPGSQRWVERWESVLGALTGTGCEDLWSVDARRALVDALLLLPEVDLWAEVLPYIPADRTAAVLERSFVGLRAADHYIQRDRWISVGLPLLGRVAPEAAERWLALAATQLPRTGIEGRPCEWFAPWSAAQRRAIVAGRLAHHQHEFLPEQLIAPWLVTLACALPPRLWPDWGGCVDAEVLARASAAAFDFTVAPVEADEVAGFERQIDRLTSSGWPTYQQVVWVFALLGRLAGEAAMTAAAATLVGVYRELSGAPSGS